MITLLALLAVAQPRPIVGFDFSLYRPGIDAGLSSSTPYRDVFGSSRRPLYGGHAGALFPLGRDLALSAVLGLSHFSVTANAFVDDGSSASPSSGTTRSAGETSLSITPVSLAVGLRLTSFLERLHVPIVPYLEVGPSYAFWSVSRGNGSTAADGATFGLTYGTGLIVELVGIDPRGRRTLAVDYGISSVALRAGVVRLALDGMGAESALPLSDTTWQLGLEIGF